MRENSESSVACHHRVGFLGLLITLGIDFLVIIVQLYLRVSSSLFLKTSWKYPC